jgi:hypothetical protein
MLSPNGQPPGRSILAVLSEIRGEVHGLHRLENTLHYSELINSSALSDTETFVVSRSKECSYCTTCTSEKEFCMSYPYEVAQREPLSLASQPGTDQRKRHFPKAGGLVGFLLLCLLAVASTGQAHAAPRVLTSPNNTAVQYAESHWNWTLYNQSTTGSQSGFQCAEFVARSLAAEGLLPGLTPTSSQSAYQYYTPGTPGNSTTYNLLQVGWTNNTSENGLYQFLTAYSGLVTNIGDNPAAAAPGDVVIYAGGEHTALLIQTGTTRDGSDTLVDSHNSASYHVPYTQQGYGSDLLILHVNRYVIGAILSKFLSLSPNFLGEATSNETGIASGRVSYFGGTSWGSNCGSAGPYSSHAAIYWTSSTGAHEVHGCIYNTYVNGYAGPNSFLGFPTGDQVNPSGGGHYQDFQNGYINADINGNITLHRYCPSSC